MATVRFSRLAEADLLEIASYTLERWDPIQTARYLDLLETASQRCADQPSLGRSCERIRSGLKRLEAGSNVIFYRAQEDGITISRILHKRTLPELHEMEE